MDIKFFSRTLDKLQKKMDLDEKVRLVVGSSAFMPLDSLSKSGGTAYATTPIPRLEIFPAIFADGPSGLKLESEHTLYPCETMLACSWDTELVKEVAEYIADESKGLGVHVLLGPDMNIQRNPLGGRNFECFSEDPYLTGKLASAYVKALQNKGMGSCIGNLALDNQESGKALNNVRVSPRAIREIYLKGFEMVVMDAKPWAVRTSANKINGVPASQNEDLLVKLLRNEWGYEGVVLSDSGSSDDAVAKLRAGVDLIEPGSVADYENISAALQDGNLGEDIVDDRVRRNLDLLARCFLGYEETPKKRLAEEYANLARKSAASGMVLLENRDTFLPFTPKERPAIIIYGRDTLIAGGGGCSIVNAVHTAPLSEGLSNAGFRITDNPDLADVAFVVISREAGEGADMLPSDFSLSKEETAMLTGVCKTFHDKEKKVVVLLNVGNAIETASWKELPDAVLLVWLPGQEGANAVADIVTGAVNPSGRLAQTFPINCQDAASSDNFPMPRQTRGKQVANNDCICYQEGIYVGYRYFDTFGKEVSYPFGYGLSYTTFSMDDPELYEYSFKDLIDVTIEVTNTGDRPGSTVVQLYVKSPARSLQEKPSKELRAFAKTRELKPGERETIIIPIRKPSLSSYNEATCSWNMDAGTYIFMVGSSSSKIEGETAKYIDQSFSIPVTDVLALDNPLNELRKRKTFFREHVKKGKGAAGAPARVRPSVPESAIGPAPVPTEIDFPEAADTTKQ